VPRELSWDLRSRFFALYLGWSRGKGSQMVQELGGRKLLARDGILFVWRLE
jgi:hypothetical protein